MTIPNAADAPLLLTDADVFARVRDLIGRACAVRQLWVMFVDGDGRQTPVVMPISGIPRRPRPGGMAGLADVLGGLRAELATDLGPGSVILTLERIGIDAVLPADRDWAAALQATCREADTRLRGIYLSSSGGVRRLSP